MIKVLSINQFARAILYKVLFSFRSTINNCSRTCSEVEWLVPWHFWNIPQQFRLKHLPLTFWCIALHLQWLLLQRVASNSKNVQCIGFKSHLVFTCWENARQSVIFFVSCPTQNGRYPQTIWDYWVQIQRTESISIFPKCSTLINFLWWLLTTSHHYENLFLHCRWLWWAIISAQSQSSWTLQV